MLLTLLCWVKIVNLIFPRDAEVPFGTAGSVAPTITLASVSCTTRKIAVGIQSLEVYFHSVRDAFCLVCGFSLRTVAFSQKAGLHQIRKTKGFWWREGGEEDERRRPQSDDRRSAEICCLVWDQDAQAIFRG